MHAANTPVAVLEASRRDDPQGADTVPLSLSAAAALRRAARGLMMTPWFAAASGFVIAASLWIYSPHAQLHFPNNNAIGVQHCNGPCAPAAHRNGSRSLSSSGRNQLPDSQTSGASRAGSQAAVTGLTFSYYLLRSPDGGFTIRISVMGKRAIKNWTLAFVLPGDRIRWLEGASWHRTHPDSGTATGAADQAGNWPGDGQDGHGQFGGHHQQYGFTFVVSGAGQPVPPTDCLYDGQACTFRQGWEGHPGTG
jgi:hypothetical protein